MIYELVSHIRRCFIAIFFYWQTFESPKSVVKNGSREIWFVGLLLQFSRYDHTKNATLLPAFTSYLKYVHYIIFNLMFVLCSRVGDVFPSFIGGHNFFMIVIVANA